MKKKYNSIGLLLTLLLSFTSLSQDFPPIDKKIVFTKQDFSSVEKMIKDGLPNKAIQELLLIQSKAISEKNLYNYHKCMEFLELASQNAGMEPSELQSLFYSQHELFNTFEGPLRNVAARDMSEWFQQIRYRDIFSFNEESLEWNLNGEKVKLKNYNQEPILDAYQTEFLKNSRDLMRISSDQIYDTSKIVYQPTVYDVLATFYLAQFRYNELADSCNWESTLEFSQMELSDVKRVYANLEQLNLKNERWETYAFVLESRIANCSVEYQSNENKLAVYEKFQNELAGFSASNRFAFRRAELYAELAGQCNWKNDNGYQTGFLQALEIIEKALTVHPKAEFNDELNELKKEILEPSLMLTFQSDIRPANHNLMKVNFRNLEKTELLIFKINGLNKTVEYRENPFKGLKLNQIGRRELHFQADSNLLFHDKDFMLTELSEPGQYLVVAASTFQDWENALHAEKYDEIKNVAFDILSLTNLAMRKSNEKDGIRILLNDIRTGKPIKNARVIVSDGNYEHNKSVSKEYRTDKNGTVKLEGKRRFYITAYHKNDSIKDFAYFYKRESEDKNYKRIFTDRSIYRPGQTVYFKSLIYNHNKAEPKVDSGSSSTVEFKDANGKVLYKNTLLTNEFGSTEGSFVLPKSGFPLGSVSVYLNGNYVDNIRVEEYKRPTYLVSFDTPKEKVALGENILIEGKVMAFAGYPITNVDVEINVSEVRFFPRWCVVDFGDESYDTTIVVKTDENGVFKLDFLPKNPKETNGVFYVFNASVVDLTGETQLTSYSMYVGKSAYTISSNVQSKYRSDQLGKILVRVQNSQGINQEGKLVQYTLKRKVQEDWYRFQYEQSEFQDFTKDELKKWKPDLNYFRIDKIPGLTIFYKGELKSGAEIDLSSILKSPAGEFEIEFQTIDELGDTVKSNQEFIVWNPKSKKNQHQEEFWMETLNRNPALGDDVVFVIGTSHEKAKLFLATYNENGLVEMKYTKIRKRKNLKLELNKDFEHGLALYAGIVKEGIISNELLHIVPTDSNRIINLKLKNIQEPLRPGSEQTWEMELTQKDSKISDAELLTGMYDASLDEILGHSWSASLLNNNYIEVNWQPTHVSTILQQETTWPQPYFNSSNYPITRGDSYFWANNEAASRKEPPVMMDAMNFRSGEGLGAGALMKEELEEVVVRDPKENEPKPSNKIRENFNETAFFFPQLHANSEGNYQWTYTLPDALTKWKMMAIAHTKDVKSAYYSQSFEARKELMLETFEPRFWRKGDSLIWVGKVTNISDKEQVVDVRMKFTNPMSDLEISAQFGNFETQQIILKPNESKAVEWKFFVPETAPILVNFEAEATTKEFSDIVRKPTPVLSGKQTITLAENFTFSEKGLYDLKLRDIEKISNEANLLSYSFQVQPQPLWGTMLSLAQLMEPKNELTESYFTQYFSAKLAQKILAENPEMKKALSTWQLADEDALTGALNQNDELKSLLLSETNWVIDAENETQQLRRLGQLLDNNNLQALAVSTWAKLMDLQLGDGTWSWVGKEQSSWYISQYIANGLAWLKESQIEIDEPTFTRSVAALNKHFAEQYSKLKKADRDKGLGLNASVIQWLYLRSFTDTKEDTVTTYYASLLIKNWKEYPLSTQAIMGLWAIRKGELEFAGKLQASFMDKARRDPKMGIYWLENQCGYGWYENNIETHAMLIEFLTKAGQTINDVRAMQMWLIQQKRTQMWDSPKSSAMACYALQKFGNVSTDKQIVTLKLSNEKEIVVPNEKVIFNFKPEVQSWTQVKSPSSIQITEDAPVFASMQVTYSDDARNIQKSTGDFRVERNYFLVQKGEEIEISENHPLETGDIVRIKIKLVSNRSLDFVYIEDPKAPGWEPVNALSGYQYSNSLYYLSNRDSRTEFFIENLNKGTHNYVYDCKVTSKGYFNLGPTKAMCYYAPTFVANTKGETFKVK